MIYKPLTESLVTAYKPLLVRKWHQFFGVLDTYYFSEATVSQNTGVCATVNKASGWPSDGRDYPVNRMSPGLIPVTRVSLSRATNA